MPPDRDGVRLLHMLEHSREAIQLVSGRTRQDLDTDRVLNLALVRLLEIVGERAGIPWAEIVGLRNRLIHGYDSVDLDVIWSIASKTCLHLYESSSRTSIDNATYQHTTRSGHPVGHLFVDRVFGTMIDQR
jgi:uncharacterized protein with HEPN domain